jgi:uncharacterized protein involved in exopolysaccharide biosynthesis
MSRYFELMREKERREEPHSNQIVEPVLPIAGGSRSADSYRGAPDLRRPSVDSPRRTPDFHRPLVNLNLSLGAIARLRWRLILSCTVVCVVLAGLVTLITPKKYASEVQFLVKNERQDLTITPAQNTNSPQLSDLNEEEVNSEMRMLLSHDLLEGVVRDDHLYAPYLKDTGETPDRRAIELAVMKLNKDLGVAAIRKTNVIQANYRAGDPDLAANVLKDLSRRYLNAHLAAHSTPGSFGFFSSELARYRDGLNKAEMATSEFRRNAQIFNPDQQRTALVAQLEDVNARLQNVEGDTHERKARLAAAIAEDNTAATRIPTDERTSVNQMTIDHLQTELADMENRRIAMLVKFKPTDRSVQELEGEIANTRRNLASARVEYAAEKTTTVNPLHQTLKAMQSDNRIDISTLEARRSALLVMQKTYLADLSKFDQNAVTLANLEQDQEIAQQNYMGYSKRFEEARLADQMDKQKFANVVMIETPVASPLSVFPMIIPNLLLGAMLGSIIGFAIAFFRPRDREAESGSGGFVDQPLRP